MSYSSNWYSNTWLCFLQCQRWIPILVYGNHFRIDTIDVQIARSRRKSSHEDNLLVVFRPNVISAIGNNTFILWLFKHTNIIYYNIHVNCKQNGHSSGNILFKIQYKASIRSFFYILLCLIQSIKSSWILSLEHIPAKMFIWTMSWSAK